MSVAFMFPGQGSQSVGMGRDLAETYPAARAVFEEVDDALDQHLSRLIFEGPEADLTLTENAQPALMAVSMAVVRVLMEEGGLDLAASCRFVAGHSLGEYSALAAAGSLSVGDAARVLRQRGQAMQQAVPVGEGGMAALLLDLETAQDVADEAALDGEVCTPANDNAPGQVVLSGALRAVRRALSIAVRRGARRSVMLPVSAPFHCELMAPAAERLAEVLTAIHMRAPSVPLISNVTARPSVDVTEIRRVLVDQVTGMVRWREGVHHMIENGVNRVVEIGAGRVLSGLARRIDRGISAVSINSPADVEAFLDKSPDSNK